METIGQQLRAARERKKVTFDIAAQATKIKSEYLAALEANQFDKIEAPVYVKGFLRIYAQYLGLDPKPLVDAFLRQHTETAMPFEPPQPMTRQPIGKTAPPPPSEEPPAVSPALIVSILGVVVVVLVLIWGIRGFWNWTRQPSQPKVVANGAPAAVAAKGDASSYLPPKSASPAQIIEPPRPPAHTLTIRADNVCDVTVTVDGEVKFRGRMPPNEVRKFDGNRITVRTSDGGALHAWYDKKDQGKLGRRGDQVVKEFAAPGTWWLPK
ncbi:MAG: helix-turn-helix domain-containing protein [Verrucomicrobiae bacterium]|nr:helix-turn-helix domain-containing protein [Verrucomicrobiae bacterium]